MTETIEKTMHFAAPRARVWDYLTKADLLGTWFLPAKADMTEGAPFTLFRPSDGERQCWGEVEEMRPVDYMRWAFTVCIAGDRMMTVEWRLDEVQNGTRLSLTHSNIPGTAEAFDMLLNLDKGWHTFLGALREKTDADLAGGQAAA